MNYHIYCNSKSIHSHYSDAIGEFAKRLSAYCNTTLHPTLNLSVLSDNYKNGHLIIFIQPGPSTYSSEVFSTFIQDLQQQGLSTIHVLIGYPPDSLNDIYEFAGTGISIQSISLTGFQLSNATVSLLFYEQLYRAYTILQGKTYHK